MKKYIFLASAAITLAACSSEEENVQTWNGEIRLSYVDVIQTRATQEIQPDAFVSGETLDVFIYENATSPQTTYDNPLKYTTNEDGSLTAPSTQYYPQNGNGVNIFSVYPTGTATDDEIKNNSEISFEVSENQTDDEDYKASDLMVGKPDGGNPVEKTASSVQLKFWHCLSKININIEAGAGVDVNDLVGATVTIYTGTNAATFNIEDALGQRQGKWVTALESQGQTAGSFVIAGELSASGNNAFVGLSAIIIPQNIPTGNPFIRIDARNQTSYAYSLPTIVNSIEFDSGKVYTYNLTVKKSGLTLDGASINNWDDAGSVDGDAILTP